MRTLAAWAMAVSGNRCIPLEGQFLALSRCCGYFGISRSRRLYRARSSCPTHVDTTAQQLPAKERCRTPMARHDGRSCAGEKPLLGVVHARETPADDEEASRLFLSASTTSSRVSCRCRMRRDGLTGCIDLQYNPLFSNFLPRFRSSSLPSFRRSRLAIHAMVASPTVRMLFSLCAQHSSRTEELPFTDSLVTLFVSQHRLRLLKNL